MKKIKASTGEFYRRNPFVVGHRRDGEPVEYIGVTKRKLRIPAGQVPKSGGYPLEEDGWDYDYLISNSCLGSMSEYSPKGDSELAENGTRYQEKKLSDWERRKGT